MYKIKYFPVAKKDIEGIVYYISHNLNNPTAALKFWNLLNKSVKKLNIFPYGIAPYQSNHLKNKYRIYRVKNYLVAYTINENNKTIAVMRVMHQNMNINNIMNMQI